ncbi:hypothetical protein QP531_06530 [Peptoniphilus harei]|uniref:hypothetical protein n=1 Tax=Peptoniphilus harei TaxID=54005 RepID=UPI00254A8AC9|nr:hypothetical protein [Peptoniphilus harei]MDK7377472.1 hypothetical protein [Peptoniphilus harei]MDK7679784.1 hypothetical protein [Peptoniphilus harei]MDU3457407.1 hypothetical protein [Peptoniphilus harei]
MENLYILIENALKELKDPSKEQEVSLILEGLRSDVIIDDMTPDVQVITELRNIGEDDIVDKVLLPFFAVNQMVEDEEEE